MLSTKNVHRPSNELFIDCDVILYTVQAFKVYTDNPLVFKVKKININYLFVSQI